MEKFYNILLYILKNTIFYSLYAIYDLFKRNYKKIGRMIICFLAPFMLLFLTFNVMILLYYYFSNIPPKTFYFPFYNDGSGIWVLDKVALLIGVVLAIADYRYE